MLDPIRVLLVDDHAVVREGLRTFLELQDGIVVVGEAADGEEAIEAAERLRPDVVLMDLVMPRLAGLGAMRELPTRRVETRVIVLTSFAEDDRLLPAIQAGAAGYLLKNVEPKELARAVRAAHTGEGAARPRRGGAGGRDDRESVHASARLGADPAGGRSAGPDHVRLFEQADRARAGDLGEDGQDSRRPSAGQARRRRPHSGGTARCPGGPCAPVGA